MKMETCDTLTVYPVAALVLDPKIAKHFFL